jgi:hypothetical protein
MSEMIQRKKMKDEKAYFPARLYFMLSELKSDGMESIASWQPDGRSFTVRKPKELELMILPL